MNFHYRTNLVTINDKIFQKIQKIMFLTHFGLFSQFFGQRKISGKPDCRAQLHMGFQHRAEIQKKLMMQFQENPQTDGGTERRTEGRTDPISQDPTSYHQGSKKGHKTFAAFFDDFEQIFSRFWFQKRFQNLVKNLRQSFLRRQLTAESRYSQKELYLTRLIRF